MGILIVQTTWESIGMYVSPVHLHHSSATSLNDGKKPTAKSMKSQNAWEEPGRKLVAESNIIRLARQKRRRRGLLMRKLNLRYQRERK